MVKRASRAYLEEIANRAHEMPEVYKCINTLQETPFKVNVSVYQVLKTIHEKGLPLAGLPSSKIPLPPKPFDIGTNEEARKDYSRKALAVHNYNATI
jgi:DNA-directed RNA polymerase